MLDNAGLFYSCPGFGQTLSRNDYDSLTGGFTALVRINRATFTGYFISPDTAGLTPGMLLLTIGYDQFDSLAHYGYPAPGPVNYQLPLGVVSRVSADSVFFQAGGVGMRDSTEYSIYPARIKSNQ